jgi:DNA-directed RNA polymerase specialized sigma24 family protein
MCSLAAMVDSVRMPVSVAARKGVSALTHEAADHRIILTSLGRPVAVVDSAERLDEDLRRIRDAARIVVGAYADAVTLRTERFSLAEVCAKLGLSTAAVESRAAELSGR